MRNDQKKATNVSTTKTTGQQAPKSINEIIHRFFRYQHGEGYKKDLWTLLELAIASDDMDEYSGLQRANILSTYKLIDELISDLETLRPHLPKVEVFY